MKQLLQTSSNLLVSALNDHAYAIVTTTNDSAAASVYELVPASSTAEANVRGDSKTSDTSNTIQAVACKTVSTKQKTIMICAVSRLDKTIELYSLPSSGDEKSTEEKMDKKEVKSMAAFRTGKRSCTLSFATVPGEEGDDGIEIIIAADLAGDVTAFPVLISAESSTASDKEGTTPASETVSRLLLGHTASMLTGVKVVTDENKKMRIITSDRDEKIRVSSFPATYVVEGYLLGHTAFVSAIDVASEKGCMRCVSCSGDGTVRLWNYETCEELALLEGVLKKDDDDDDKNETEEKDSEMKDADKGSNDENTDDKNADKEEKLSESNDDDSFLIPFGVSINSNGTNIAVIREGASFLDIYTIVESSEQDKAAKMKFEKKQTIECSFQPLGIKFVTDNAIYILTKESVYLQCFQYDESKSLFVENSTLAVCTALKNAAISQDVKMPESVLETDSRGQIKLVKVQQKPAFAKNEELWNNSSRLLTAKKRAARRRKRRREGGNVD
uniref:tRNA (guanine-N(7)-)-methyltransferase non-catalytic subunit n=1 Tax=Ditylum brightwellii TaxID=49249 RepID=A0A7S1ZNK7_9STRA|mmetsp:Transcript_35810/g.53381  ORF Transcript_35810/g.53381 Transcript_35810/m.53381 type:complete len:501 (+) Transcript_35810:114-1616(+)